jgi:hypothetical protein
MKLPRYLMPAILIAPMACAVIAAPPALAGCNATGDTLACAQGHVRGHNRAQVFHLASPFTTASRCQGARPHAGTGGCG